MRIRFVLGLLLFCVLPSALEAQGTCPALEAGSTIRLRPTPEVTYTLPAAVLPSDTLIVLSAGRSPREVSIRCSDVRLQLHAGRQSRGRSALKGAGIGFLAGAVFGAALGAAEGGSDPSDELPLFSERDMALLAGAYFGGIGTIGGAVVGFIVPGNRWVDVPAASRPSRASVEGLRIGPAGRSQVRVSYTLPL